MGITSNILSLGLRVGANINPGGNVLARSPILYGLSGHTKLVSTKNFKGYSSL